ncbi:UDP-2,3-diacylglucosamine diphosphatase [Thiomicrorhabdus sp. zzn3]|uniref:UDP-2,3-diacylglucosamine diphosphatase n=1 Tax=Thiomicrorhabdus sp. zzn3 TaxID=3039775 RepID=UPI0024368B2D|nr:UDP-2,3-diacylglucosamine diphosphatase [Thiomicrorhabdus sp. zzn3]MDG6778179.1 UDP-2,3-diacylglucosamine diphosphatase [Thiomicrorhabdus sp. zzn3]
MDKQAATHTLSSTAPYTLFIADVHLQPDFSDPINQAFMRFLKEEAPLAQALYILGDLFEMWVGDDVGLELYAPVIEQFAQLSQAGLPIYLQYGNRDFLMRHEFWKASGIQKLKEPYAITLHGHSLLLMHGDTLCTDDKEYQKMRRILRNPVVTWSFLHLPQHKRLQIGQNMREKSKKYSSNKAENIMDVSNKAVTALFKRYPDVTHLIHGHTHRPAHHALTIEEQTKHRWVLGDWRPQSKILKVSTEGLTLLSYPFDV